MIDDIKERFLEAARTERLLPAARIRPAGAKGYWPEIVHTEDDIRGWGGERYGEQRERDFERVTITASAEAISRWEECHRWTCELVERDVDRKAIWAWAMSQTRRNGDWGAFSSWCRQNGISRTIGYVRVNKAATEISAKIGKELGSFRISNEIDGLQNDAETGTNTGIIEEIAPGAIQSWMADDAKPVEDRPDQRDFTWASEQTERWKKVKARLGRATEAA